MAPAHWTRRLAHLILPAITLGTALAAILARMLRQSLVQVRESDYMRTAIGKGLSANAALMRHGLRNALTPVVTLLGLQLGGLLTGAIITEVIFSWPGLGRLMITAISARDYPLVEGCVLTFALTYVVVNMATDMVYGLIDPRIRLSGARRADAMRMRQKSLARHRRERWSTILILIGNFRSVALASRSVRDRFAARARGTCARPSARMRCARTRHARAAARMARASRSPYR